MTPEQLPAPDAAGIAGLVVGLAPVLNVSDLAAERSFYEGLGLPVVYEGDEYPDFIAFGTDTVHSGIQPAPTSNDPPTVLTWQLVVSALDAAAGACQAASIAYEVEDSHPGRAGATAD
jgi:catechol 2,3-dioxygenase-like lactoylglutathione lyase family enzyme